jgi:V/A-type H+-transporting ATPase subunit I
MLVWLRRLVVPAPMVRVGLFFLAKDAPKVVSVLAELGVCQVAPVPTELKDYLVPSFPEEFREAYRRLRECYEPMAHRWAIAGETELAADAPHVPSTEDLGRLCQKLEPICRQIRDLDERHKQLQNRQLELDHFGAYARALAELDINVPELADLRFLHLRPGIVPLENLARLQESATLGEDLVLTVGIRNDRAHVLVIGAGGITPALQGLLAKAHFEPLASPNIPALERIGSIHAYLQAEAVALQAAQHQLQTDEESLKLNNRDLIHQAAQLLAWAAVFTECDGALEGREAVAFLSGWVPQDRLAECEQALAREVPHLVVALHVPPTSDLQTEPPPSEMTVPRVLQPGASLVWLYGPPGRDELNPTLVLALTTPVLFGMMFGDVGHGLLLAIATVACRRWLGQWIAPILSCSLGAVGFGLLYGSVFGIEHVLPALWLRPMDEPFRLLAAALWVGVAFVLGTFVLKSISLARQGRWREGLFGFHGAAGAVFYLGTVCAVRSLYLEQTVPIFSAVLIAGGLLATAAHAAKEFHVHGRPALVDLTIEYCHGTLTLLTNTLSFLRLAAFALAHSALMIARFLLVEMVPPTIPGWAFRALLLSIGSLLILALDVLAVAVQTLRLEFYEGLARYYRGDGRSYQPLRFPTRTPF